MSFFYYNSGAVDQVGGIIVVPGAETYLPAFQGPVYTLPSGLIVSGGRKFIWTLEQAYPGVVLTDEETETPTLTFTIPPFNELLVQIRCTIKGQPNNFVVYTLNTNINEKGTFSLNQASISKPKGLAIESGGFTLDNSLENKAVKALETTGDMSLYWIAPTQSFNVSGYEIDRLVTPQRIWFPLDTTANTSYNIPAILRDYSIRPIGNPYFVPRRFVISINEAVLLGKSFANLSLFNSQTKGSPIEPGIQPTFFTFNTTENEEDNIILSLNNYAKSSVMDPTPIVNFFTLAEFLNDEDSIEFNLNSYSTNNMINIVDNQPNFFTEDIGV